MKTTGMVVGFIVFLCAGLSPAAVTDIFNGDFELFDTVSGLGFNPPTGWQRYNYAAVHSSFIPRPEYGQIITWTIPAPYSRNYFVVLSTGDSGPDREIKTAKISQQITLEPGDILYGAYFFGTCDYPDYYDTGTITLIPEPNTPTDPNIITLVNIDVGDIGAYGSTEDWVPFEYTYTAADTGFYDLECKVEDGGRDIIYKSYLAVDSLVICRGGPRTGDINRDCSVNLLDFSFLADQWLNDCNDPNNTPPKSRCKDCDISGNNLVDPPDLELMSENWLAR